MNWKKNWNYLFCLDFYVFVSKIFIWLKITKNFFSSLQYFLEIFGKYLMLFWEFLEWFGEVLGIFWGCLGKCFRSVSEPSFFASLLLPINTWLSLALLSSNKHYILKSSEYKKQYEKRKKSWKNKNIKKERKYNQVKWI